MQTTTETAAPSPADARQLKTAMEQAASEIADLSADLDDAVAFMNAGRDQLAAFAAMMPAESARQIVIAVRAARKALRLVTAQLAVDFPE